VARRPRSGEINSTLSLDRATSAGRATNNEFELSTDRAHRGSLVDGRYELLEQLSEGGTGQIFRARHHDLGRTCAVKLLRRDIRTDARVREHFFREARLASSLVHPNLVGVLDFGFDKRAGFYLVMNLLEGPTLRQRMQEALSIRAAMDVIEQIAEAVRYLHELGITHCDLKPENIILVSGEPHTGAARRQNVVKVLDFGLSWSAQYIDDPMLAGTPPYLAPERLAGSDPAPSNDIYALGAMLYELVAGITPYTGSINEMIAEQMRGILPPPPSLSCKERIDDFADQMILKALARDPARRHPGIEAFLFEIRTLMRMMGMHRRRGQRDASQRNPLPGRTGKRPQANPKVVLDSPIPLAVFEASGKLRVANGPFLDAAGERQGRAVGTWSALGVVRRTPALAAAFRTVTTEGKPGQVVLGRKDNGQMVAMLAPVMDGARVESVHVTLIPLDA
jgi:serine/threonine-protein kinase